MGAPVWRGCLLNLLVLLLSYPLLALGRYYTEGDITINGVSAVCDRVGAI